MFHLILNDKVHEQFAEKPQLHPDLLVVENKDAKIKIGYLYQNGKFTAPVKVDKTKEVLTKNQLRSAMNTRSQIILSRGWVILPQMFPIIEKIDAMIQSGEITTLEQLDKAPWPTGE